MSVLANEKDHKKETITRLIWRQWNGVMGRPPWEDAFWAETWKRELSKCTSRGQAFQTEERAGAKGLRQGWVQRTARKSECGGWWMSEWEERNLKTQAGTWRSWERVGMFFWVWWGATGESQAEEWSNLIYILHGEPPGNSAEPGLYKEMGEEAEWPVRRLVQQPGRDGPLRFLTDINVTPQRGSIILCNTLCDSEQRLWNRLPGFTTSELSDLFLLT